MIEKDRRECLDFIQNCILKVADIKTSSIIHCCCGDETCRCCLLLDLLILKFLLFLPIPITGRLEVSIIIIIIWRSSTTPQPRPPTQFWGVSFTYSPPITKGFLNNVEKKVFNNRDEIFYLASDVGWGVCLPPMTTVLSGCCGCCGLYFCPMTNGSRASYDTNIFVHKIWRNNFLCVPTWGGAS